MVFTTRLMARTVLLLLLLFVLQLALGRRLSISNAHQGGDNVVVGRCRFDVPTTEVPTKTMQGTSENKTGGRKILSKTFVDIEKMEPTISVRSKDLKRINGENYEARFVAFNADYKGPRRHPPKNN